jgi:hypothetical protein
LDKINSLRPVTYNWINESQNSSSTRYTGFIAQEVLPLFPDLVSVDNVGNYQLSYSGFIPYIVSAIKDLNDKIVSVATGIFEKVQTKQLCIEDVCLTKTELKALLDKNSVTPQVIIPESTPSQNTNTASSEDVSTTTGSVIIETEASLISQDIPPIETIVTPESIPEIDNPETTDMGPII